MSLWKSSFDHSLADVEQVSAFSAEGEAFLKPGGLMVAWENRLDDFESLSAEEVEAICKRFDQALGQLNDMDMLHVVHHRLPAPNYPEREFPTEAAALVDAERRAAFGSERYWVTFVHMARSQALMWSDRACRLCELCTGYGHSTGRPDEKGSNSETLDVVRQRNACARL